jgi:hypothetical protein
MYDFYEELEKIKHTSYSMQFCRDGVHTWITYGASSSEEIPEGAICSCGKMKAAYEKCLLCGCRKLVAEEIEGD